MSALVTIVVSGGGASEKMLMTCLGALDRHRGATRSKTVLVAPSHQMAESWAVAEKMGVPFRGFGVGRDKLSGSRTHASVLDQVVPHIDTPCLLTLDADCFPVADDWLDELMDMIGEGAAVAGILHPYAPPSLPTMSMSASSIEYRIRSQLCSLNTHVACQLVGVDTLRRIGVGFSDGDDTGLAIPVQARKRGMMVRGLPLSGCARPDADFQEMESNRECCLLFGDKVYHHGGGSREVQDKGSPLAAWEPVRKQVLDKGGAEFLLEDPYRYSFGHEEEVADEMVLRIMRGMRIYLETHDRAFKE